MGIPLPLDQVTAAIPYVQYIATANQTIFPYPFAITQDSDLVVYFDGIAQPTDALYSLTGQGNPTGGNVISSVPVAAGSIITLVRDIGISRLTQFAQNGGFSSAGFNAEFNNVYLIMQQLSQQIGLCFQVPPTNVSGPVTTFTPAAYAGKYLGFDVNGNPQPITPISLQVPASGAILVGQTVLEATAGITPTNYTYAVGNVLRYGADPTGLSDSTVAFGNAAIAGAQASNPSSIGGTGITFALSAKVVVPLGNYTIGSPVNTDNVQAMYVLADGVNITGISNLNNAVVREGERVNTFTYGIGQTACAFSISCGASLELPGQIMGFTAASQIGSYPTRDSVALYVENKTPAPLGGTIANSGTTYSPTVITFAIPLTTAQLAALRVGMIIDTSHSPLYWSGFIQSWTATTITTSGFYKSDNSGAGTPTNGTGAVISQVTKIWALNTNNIITTAAASAGYELGTINDYADPGSATATPSYSWGFDSVNLGTYPGSVAYIARASSSYFYNGFRTQGNLVGFYCDGQSRASSIGIETVNVYTPVYVNGTLGTFGINVTGTFNAASTMYGQVNNPTYGTTVTANAINYYSSPVFTTGQTLTNGVHYLASSATFNSATVTNQIGFEAGNLTGATNNYGFYSAQAAASGSFAFYGAGTANSQFGGGLGIYGNAAPAQSTGWGTPVGGAVVNNYNITDAGGSNSNTNKVLAQVVAVLKAFGLLAT